MLIRYEHITYENKNNHMHLWSLGASFQMCGHLCMNPYAYLNLFPKFKTEYKIQFNENLIALKR